MYVYMLRIVKYIEVESNCPGVFEIEEIPLLPSGI